MKRYMDFIVPVLACFAVGYVSSVIQAEPIEEWYPLLNKPTLTPPNWVFPVVWNILYLLMGLSFGLVLRSGKANRRVPVGLFVAQLALNFAWSFCFFYLRNPFAALVVIFLLEAVLVAYAIVAWRFNRWSTIMVIPYMVWVAFATYLNFYIYLNN